MDHFQKRIGVKQQKKMLNTPPPQKKGTSSPALSETTVTKSTLRGFSIELGGHMWMKKLLPDLWMHHLLRR